MRKEEAKTKGKALVVLGVFTLSVFSVAAVAGQASSSQPALKDVSEQSEEEQQVDYKILEFGDNPAVVSVLVDPDEGEAVYVWSNLEVERGILWMQK
jgi:hypothetical protein